MLWARARRRNLGICRPSGAGELSWLEFSALRTFFLVMFGNLVRIYADPSIFYEERIDILSFIYLAESLDFAGADQAGCYGKQRLPADLPATGALFYAMTNISRGHDGTCCTYCDNYYRCLLGGSQEDNPMDEVWGNI